MATKLQYLAEIANILRYGTGGKEYDQSVELLLKNLSSSGDHEAAEYLSSVVNSKEKRNIFPQIQKRGGVVFGKKDTSSVIEKDALEFAIIVTSNNSELFSELSNKHQCGWFDGGCYVFAKGVQRFLEGRGIESRLGAITRYFPATGKDIYEHFFVEVETVLGDKYHIDGHGISVPDVFFETWKMEEGYKENHYSSSIVSPYQDYSNTTIVDDELSTKISSKLESIINNPLVSQIKSVIKDEEGEDFDFPNKVIFSEKHFR